MPEKNVGRLIFVNWVASQCPFCEAVNWVYCGRPDDITGIDIYSCRCYSCQRYFWLDEDAEEIFRMMGSGLSEDDPCQPEEADYEEGKPEPK